MTRKALGRGLNALLRTVEATTTGLEQIPVDQIEPNPFQPRRQFADEGLKELAESIRGSGVVQPVLLRPAPGQEGRYQLVAGERRWRAAKLAELESVPAVVRPLGDRDALEFALTENLLREDLNPLEVAHAYQALQEQFGLSHEEIADRLGLNRSTVTNTLRLLRLPAEVQELLSRGELSFGHAKALLSLASPAAQTKLAHRIVKQGLSVRQTEDIVALPELKPEPGKPEEAPKLDPNVRAAMMELERILGTRVKITGGGKRGKIEVSYFSSEDLTRIYDLIVKNQEP
ncbi:MAG: ParB/RepB/Spo0J family partition protein [Acidobacteriia bacterium]|nr:ParB/RepB/Spo0J family partition protein [Terriglobia bacterium]